MVVRINDKKKNYGKVTKLLVKPNYYISFLLFMCILTPKYLLIKANITSKTKNEQGYPLFIIKFRQKCSKPSSLSILPIFIC